MSIRLQLLGSADLTGPNGGRLHAALAQPKRFALLAFLAVDRPQRLHRRDALLATFWPERSDEAGRGALSQSLSYLRRALGDDAIVTRGNDEVGVDHELVACDACEFEAAADEGDHPRALALYAGDFLAAFHVDDCQPFDAWLDAERHRLRDRAVACASACSEGAARTGDWDTAIASARRALGLAPHDERAVRHVLRALDGAGHRVRALEEYESFVTRLAADLDLQPSAELREASESIRRGARVSPLGGAAEPRTSPAVGVITLPEPPVVPPVEARSGEAVALAPPSGEAVALAPPVARLLLVQRPVNSLVTSASAYFFTAHPRAAARRAYALYAFALPFVALLAYAATEFIGLPGWVLPGAVLVMALGLPAMLFTHWVNVLPRRVRPPVPGDRRGLLTSLELVAVQALPFVSWKRAWMGMVVGLGGFALFVVTFMAMRTLGVGPARTPMSEGTVRARERLVIADFDGTPADSALRETISSVFRAALAQSQTLAVMPPRSMHRTLEQLHWPPRSRVSFDLARALAVREGLKAFIDGEVHRLGGHFALSARLVVALSGEERIAVSETAKDEGDLVAAVGRMAAAMRERIGESLRDVRRARPLERVTTSSLDALQDYLGAMRMLEDGGATDQVTERLDRATALDPGFAAASLLHATVLWREGRSPAKRRALVRQAYEHRDRLSDTERERAIAAFHWWGPAPRLDKSIEAFEALLEIDPFDAAALNSLGELRSRARAFTAAEALFRRAVVADSLYQPAHANLVTVRAALGQQREAEQALDALQRLFPRATAPVLLRAHLSIVRGRFDDAERRLDSLSRAQPANAQTTSPVAAMRTQIARESGRITEALRWSAQQHGADVVTGARAAPLLHVLDEVHATAWLRGDSARALRALTLGLAAHPVASVPADEVPYEYLVRVVALVDAPERAVALLAQAERRRDQDDASVGQGGTARMRGHVALAQHRPSDAIAAYRAADVGLCARCVLPDLARAYEAAGNTDSSLAVLQRYVATPPQIAERPPALYGRSPVPPLAAIYRRLGELHEARGDTAHALADYRAVVELWGRADAELQPQVAAARLRIERLGGKRR